MWGSWFFPLVILPFLGGAAAALVWYIASREGRRPRIAMLVAVPLGCAALPIAALALIGAVDSFFQKSDPQLYEEIFGYRSTITEDRLMFDDFGSGTAREIFMRAEPTATERSRLLAVPGLVSSKFTPEQFIARGDKHGFTWWVSADPLSGGECRKFRIREAHGFRGWREFRVAECLQGGPDFPADLSPRHVFVIASGRA